MSTHPGATSRPRASTSRRPALATAPTAAIRFPSIARSPCWRGEPLPSTRVPPRITRSCMQDDYQGRARPVHLRLLLLAARVPRHRALPCADRRLLDDALLRACASGSLPAACRCRAAGTCGSRASGGLLASRLLLLSACLGTCWRAPRGGGAPGGRRRSSRRPGERHRFDLDRLHLLDDRLPRLRRLAAAQVRVDHEVG